MNSDFCTQSYQIQPNRLRLPPLALNITCLKADGMASLTWYPQLMHSGSLLPLACLFFSRFMYYFLKDGIKYTWASMGMRWKATCIIPSGAELPCLNAQLSNDAFHSTAGWPYVRVKEDQISRSILLQSKNKLGKQWRVVDSLENGLIEEENQIYFKMWVNRAKKSPCQQPSVRALKLTPTCAPVTQDIYL